MVRVVSLNDAVLKHVITQYGVSKGEIPQPDGVPVGDGRRGDADQADEGIGRSGRKTKRKTRRKTRKKPYGGKVWTDEEEKAWRKGEWELEVHGSDFDLKGGV